MTQPDQSELESDIEMLLLRVYNGEYDRSASQTLADVKKRIVSLITANYTPNSEVTERERVAVIKAQLGMIEYYDQVPNNKDMDWKGLFSDNRKHLEDELTKAKEQPNE